MAPKREASASYKNIEKPPMAGGFLILVDLVAESWKHLHAWVFEASEVISGASGSALKPAKL